MPRRNDIKSVMLIGAGPIVIGQACEFDYSGTQACRALKEEGYRVVLLNSNPATIMTDPEFADATYIEPINWQVAEHIIETERPDALLPTMGGQTALNCALDLASHGVLKKHGVEMIGASPIAIEKSENRELFKHAMEKIGLKTAVSRIARNVSEANEHITKIGFPAIIRPSFTLGGSGGGIAYNLEEFQKLCEHGFIVSPTHELLIEQSLIGWKEFEMEVVRDSNDNCIIVCSIENLDPMGVHTGDSVTVAPIQTLTDKEYQIMRNSSIAVLREIGVDTGGSNVQFAVNPENGEQIVIEVNPRVSRSSALASKATGFPIAKVATKLAIGYTLDELKNEITGNAMPASFEPTIDYVVTKIPRFAFEKFPKTPDLLTTQMKSIGEVMAIGRTFLESIQKALRSLESGTTGFDQVLFDKKVIKEKLSIPSSQRLLHIADAFRSDMTVQEIHALSKVDPWFLREIERIVKMESDLSKLSIENLDSPKLLEFKRAGFGDSRIATLLGVDEDTVREKRHNMGLHPVFKRIDSCAAEFKTETAYMYSTYEDECESRPSKEKKIMILGSGPNRIGQGLEFDYCCVHASLALRKSGYETIMVNCNPETVSTDYDISDRLYFEPLTVENILEINAVEESQGIIIQFGGQTPLRLAQPLKNAGAPIIGTTVETINRTESREKFRLFIKKCGLTQPENAIAHNKKEGIEIGNTIGYPLVVRPSYVLGGQSMKIVHDEQDLESYLNSISLDAFVAGILLDKFLNNATEIDIDAVCDGHDTMIGGVIEHIEQAGVHSGDSTCSLPPFSLSQQMIKKIENQMHKITKELKPIGLINAQFAIQNNTIYVLEVNPRASRTVPFVSKATGKSLAKIAAEVIVGKKISCKNSVNNKVETPFFSVKEAAFPFSKFPESDVILGPEMKSTGEIMGIGKTFADAFWRAQAALVPLPQTGNAVFSVRNSDKKQALLTAKRLQKCGFSIYATPGTAEFFEQHNVNATSVLKVSQGRPNIVDKIKSGEFQIVINTVEASLTAISDSFSIRQSAIQHKVIYFTTMAGAEAASLGIDSLQQQKEASYATSLQTWHGKSRVNNE